MLHKWLSVSSGCRRSFTFHFHPWTSPKTAWWGHMRFCRRWVVSPVFSTPHRLSSSINTHTRAHAHNANACRLTWLYQCDFHPNGDKSSLLWNSILWSVLGCLSSVFYSAVLLHNILCHFAVLFWTNSLKLYCIQWFPEFSRHCYVIGSKTDTFHLKFGLSLPVYVAHI